MGTKDFWNIFVFLTIKSTSKTDFFPVQRGNKLTAVLFPQDSRKGKYQRRAPQIRISVRVEVLSGGI